MLRSPSRISPLTAACHRCVVRGKHRRPGAIHHSLLASIASWPVGAGCHLAQILRSRSPFEYRKIVLARTQGKSPDSHPLTTVSKALIVAEGYHQGQVTPTAPRTITNGPTFFITCIQPDRTPTIVSRTSASWGRHEQSLAPPTRSQSAVVPHVLRSGGWAVYVPGHGMNQGTS